ncbi:unnamed protein product [Rhizophagus irregularis]|nr:unnamed protein product [Rhizophagus irregularis]
MDHQNHNSTIINNDNKKITSYISLNNTSSAQYYRSHYSRIIRRRRNQRELRKRTYALYRQLVLQGLASDFWTMSAQ